MKPSTVKTNEKLAAEMSAQMADYLAHGGQVTLLRQGDTGFRDTMLTADAKKKKAMLFTATRKQGGAK